MIKRAISQSLLLAALLGIGSAAIAQVPDNDGYLFDTRGNPVMTGTGLCWKTTRWTPAMAIEQCDPDLTKKPEAAKSTTSTGPATKPMAEKITLSADTLFDFDKAVLRPEGKAALDDLVGKVKTISLQVITATGHTDRIGSDKYNQKLSERRAASVQQYLVSKGVDAGKIVTEGKGKKQPVTGDKCKNMGKEHRSNKKLVACLQPDRRVNIEIIGTRESK